MPQPFLISILGALLAMVRADPAVPSAYSAPVLKLEPVAFKLRDGSSVAAERGFYEVPEQRGNAASRKIRIGFVRFKSTSAQPGAPIVYLAGGPGGSGVDAARGPRQPIFLSLRALGDVIALDQRGTGLSNPIQPCTASTVLDPAGGINEASLTGYYRRTLKECLATWRRAGVSVEGYNTRESADDLDDLRKALGVPQIRLWAISYGTHLALATMRRHPSAIDRVVLASAEGMDQTVKLPDAVEAALGRVATFARRNGKADDLLPLMKRVHARLDAVPARLSVVGPSGPIRFTMDSFALRMLIGAIAKDPDGIRDLLAIYGAFDANKEQSLARMLYDLAFKTRLVMTGMPELMDLSSGISRARLRDVERQAGTSPVGDATNFPMPQLADAAPDLALNDNYRREIQSAIPTLLFSGDLDLRTPMEEQAVATAGLQRLTRIVVHNGGHDLFEADPRIPTIITAFLKSEYVRDTSLTIDPARSSPTLTSSAGQE